MIDLRPDGLVELEYGVSVRSIGVTGTAGEVLLGPSAGGQVRDAEPDGLAETLAQYGVPGSGAEVLGTAAERAGLRRRLLIPLDELASAAAPEGPLPTRGDDDAPHLEITLPAPDPDTGQLLLEIDATGVLRWHFAGNPGAGTPELETPWPRDRAEDTQVFRVPIAQLDVGAADDAHGDRGLTAFGIRKALHVIRFPIEWAAGRAANAGIRRWEHRHRPCRLHRASPAYFTGAGDPVDADWLRQQDDGPILLLLHGTFSVGHAAFAGLGADTELLDRWRRAYGGRVLVFDHPSLHADPAENVRDLLALLPSDRRVILDVLAHSRGGLVARWLSTLAAGGADAASRVGPVGGTGGPTPVIRRLVHVATPNAGTTLAARERLGDLLDLVTNVIGVCADEGSGAIAAAIVELVRQAAVGAIGGLPGITAMDPDNDTLRSLNGAPARAATVTHAITSDYSAAGGGLPARALDALADAVFRRPNDLVVPTVGVYQADGYRVEHPLDLSGQAPSVAHSGFFGHPGVRRKLDEWFTSGGSMIESSGTPR